MTERKDGTYTLVLEIRDAEGKNVVKTKRVYGATQDMVKEFMDFNLIDAAVIRRELDVVKEHNSKIIAEVADSVTNSLNKFAAEQEAKTQAWGEKVLGFLKKLNEEHLLETATSPPLEPPKEEAPIESIEPVSTIEPDNLTITGKPRKVPEIVANDRGGYRWMVGNTEVGVSGEAVEVVKKATDELLKNGKGATSQEIAKKAHEMFRDIPISPIVIERALDVLEWHDGRIKRLRVKKGQGGALYFRRTENAVGTLAETRITPPKN